MTSRRPTVNARFLPDAAAEVEAGLLICKTAQNSGGKISPGSTELGGEETMPRRPLTRIFLNFGIKMTYSGACFTVQKRHNSKF